MIVSGFGVDLKRLRHHDIELVRQHRNSTAIARYMAVRDNISKEDQEKWFVSIDNKLNNYFIIYHESKQIGMIYGADINWDIGETGNGGIFIWDESAYELHGPLAASMLLTEVSFLLEMERTYIKVMRDNMRAISYNKNLGYQMLPGQENELNQKYVLTEKKYYQKTARLRKIFVGAYGDIFTITLDQPYHEAEINMREVYSHISPENKKRLKLKC